MTINRSSDVCIAGGGLAGLSLALQLKQARPELDVVLLEQRKHPVPVAAHKVGESTVRIGAHYFAQTINQKEHLESSQLRKFGLRFFFGGPEKPADLSGYDELGGSEFLPVRTYQIDRGVFENHLFNSARAAEISVHDATSVQTISLGEKNANHRIVARTDSGELTLDCQWLVDCTGRAARLRKQLELTKPVAHRHAAVWFRTANRLDIDDCSSNAEWRARCGDSRRWRSTNHLMGPGYWFWLIPLASGATSVGLVFDPEIIPVRSVNSFDRLVAWLQINEPLMANFISAERESVMDFLTLRSYSHSARQVFSADGWALSGDAGVFLDPFYSSGSDFIAISNTLISQLVLDNGSPAERHRSATFYQQLYMSAFSSSLSLYQGHYQGFGDRELMSLKSTWDFAYYWSVLAFLFYTERLADVDFIDAHRAPIAGAWNLNARMQGAFRELASRRRQLPARGGLIDQCDIAFLTDLKQQLIDADPAAASTQLMSNIDFLEAVATVIRAQLARCESGEPIDLVAATRGLSLSTGRRRAAS